jgi:hypothetical protein
MARIQLRFRRVARSPCGWTAEDDARLAAGGEGEARREDADDGGGLTAEAEGRPEDLGVRPQPRPPEGVGEHDRAGAAGLVLAGEEAASEGRAYAEDVEEARGHEEGRQLLRLGRPVQATGATE